MIQRNLKFELMNQLSIIKSTLRDCEESGEISRALRVKIMTEIGQIKQCLYDEDVDFKSLYQKHRPRAI